MTDKQLYQLCKEYGLEARKWKNRFIALLPEVYKRRVYKQKGFGSIFEFAAKLGGVSRNVVEDALNLDVKLQDKPKLKALIPQIGINKVRVVANISTKENESEWAIKAQNMTKAALETHVREVRNSDPGIGKPTAPHKKLYSNEYKDFTAKLDPKIIQKLKVLKANMVEGTCWNDVFAQLLESKKGKKLKKSRARNLITKAKNICEVPGCNKPTKVIHHPDRWSLTKNHNRLVSVCKTHHELAHRGYLDEKNGLKALIKPIIDPLKQLVDQKMLQFLKGI